MPKKQSETSTGDSDLDAMLEQLVLEMTDLFAAEEKTEDKECGQ